MEGEETKKNGGIELDWDRLNIDEDENENEASYHYEMLRRLSDVEILAIFKRYENELERRKLLPLKDDGGCKKPNPLDISTSVDASDSCREGDAPSRSSSQSKFAACFVNKLDEHRTESFMPDANEKKMSRETPFRSDGNLSGDTKKINVSNSPRPPSPKRQRISSLQGQTSSHEKHGNQLQQGEHVVEELEAETMTTQEDRIDERDDFEDFEISCLDPGHYWSSTIMNFYIRYLQGQTSPSGSGTGGCNFYICNTHFYEKLKKDFTGKSMEEDPFAEFRRWWKDVNKSERAFVLLPIHERLASLVIICKPDEARQSGPIMLHLDPDGGAHHRGLIFSNIRRFLTEGIFAKQEALDPLQKLPPIIHGFIVKVPRVRDCCDCCVFVLFFMKKFIAEAPKRLKKMFGEKWFTHAEAMCLRSEIKKLL